MSLLRPRVRDDRGAARPLVMWISRPAAEALRSTRSSQQFTFVSAILLGALIGVLPTLAAFDMLRQVMWRWTVPEGAAPTTGGSSILGILMAALIVLPMAAGVLISGWLAWRHLAPRIFRAARLCPTCALGLEGLKPEPDGCTICPECGAAWKLPNPEKLTTTVPHAPR